MDLCGLELHYQTKRCTVHVCGLAKGHEPMKHGCANCGVTWNTTRHDQGATGEAALAKVLPFRKAKPGDDLVADLLDGEKE